MAKRVYVDTSVVGGLFDKEFSSDTVPFFEAVTKGLFVIIVSDLLEAELLRAPKTSKRFFSEPSFSTNRKHQVDPGS